MTEPFCTITCNRGGDRQKFYNFCLHQIARFDPAPTEFFLIDHPPTTNAVDITLRVKLGIAAAKAKGIDICFIVESDDFYNKDYFATMYPAMENADFVGCSRSLYYNLKNKTYAELQHPKRSSLYCTGFRISALEGFDWPPDNTTFLDVALWKYAQKKRHILFDFPVGVGIKHGIGKVGGAGHRMTFENKDTEDMVYLQSVVDREAFIFYRSL